MDGPLSAYLKNSQPVKSEPLKTIQIQFFSLIKSSKIDFIFLPVFYLIMLQLREN